jgi:antirestriction factor ArdC-like protein
LEELNAIKRRHASQSENQSEDTKIRLTPKDNEPNPRAAGFNYGIGWGSAPKPNIYQQGVMLILQRGVYSGINIPILWAAAKHAGYVDHAWLTFKQAIELGGCVRKGEKSTDRVYQRAHRQKKRTRSAKRTC